MTASDDSWRRAVVDGRRSTCLCDQGGGPYSAAVLIGIDGHTDYVLVNSGLLGDGHSTYNPTTPTAPHEQDGSLDASWCDRITLAPLRCSRTTVSGRRCRTIVHRAGQSCWRHQDTTE
jgi:hypothetical protein